jgi:hypothetical protein
MIFSQKEQALVHLDPDTALSMVSEKAAASGRYMQVLDD